MDRKEIKIWVRGEPAPKGSYKGTGKGAMPAGSAINRDKLASWTGAVRTAAAAAMAAAGYPDRLMFINEPLMIHVLFYMARPRKHFVVKGEFAGAVRGDAPKYHISKPDGSKLLRSTEDDLTGIVFDDDSRIAISGHKKLYAEPGREGAWISISRLVDDDGAKR